jgi:hypothetical protein
MTMRYLKRSGAGAPRMRSAGSSHAPPRAELEAIPMRMLV